LKRSKCESFLFRSKQRPQPVEPAVTRSKPMVMSLVSARTRLGVLVLLAILVPLQAQDLGPKHHAKVRVHFVAADEIDWDYAPSGRDEAMGHPFHDFARIYMEAGPHRIRSGLQEVHL
jgi:hypothetical protein